MELVEYIQYTVSVCHVTYETLMYRYIMLYTVLSKPLLLSKSHNVHVSTTYSNLVCLLICHYIHTLRTILFFYLATVTNAHAFLHSLLTVSYTHLDVYKRQGLYLKSFS